MPMWLQVMFAVFLVVNVATELRWWFLDDGLEREVGSLRHRVRVLEDEADAKPACSKP